MVSCDRERRIDPRTFSQAGLYLLFPDGNRLDLTEEIIHRTTRSFLDDPVRLPPEARAAAEYQPCEICPKRETAEICHAIMAFLPFVDQIDRYLSYDSVTAVFRAQESNILHVRETTMQEALKYLSMLSLMHYCEVGRKYFPFFQGVNPLNTPEEMARCVFCNLHVNFGGDLEEMRQFVQQMQDEIAVTTRCQMDRLRLICRHDVFANSLVNFQMTAQWLDIVLRQMAGPPMHREAG